MMNDGKDDHDHQLVLPSLITDLFFCGGGGGVILSLVLFNAAINGNLDPTLSKTSPLVTFCHEIPRSRFTHHSPSLIEN